MSPLSDSVAYFVESVLRYPIVCARQYQSVYKIATLIFSRTFGRGWIIKGPTSVITRHNMLIYFWPVKKNEANNLYFMRIERWLEDTHSEGEDHMGIGSGALCQIMSQTGHSSWPIVGIVVISHVLNEIRRKMRPVSS